MHGQGNYTTQVGQGPYIFPPLSQQNPVGDTAPASTPPPPPPPPHFPLGPLVPPLVPQVHVITQGHPSFQPPPGSIAYPNALPGAPRQGPPAPSGISSSKSYLTHPPPPPQVHGSTQISHSYPTSEQQCLPWSQNVHQLPPRAPLPAPSSYMLPSSQGYTMERGPTHRFPYQHPAPPGPPPYSSSSNFLAADPYGSSVLSVPQNSYSQPPLEPLPPPPLLPPPPPPPPSSPPGVAPLPPSSPPTDNLSKYDGTRSLMEDLPYGDMLALECPHPRRLAEESSVHKTQVVCQSTEKNGPKMKAVDAIVAHSPADSDMDMEG